MLSPDGRRIANHETVESVLDVPELEPLTVSPRMGATESIFRFPTCRRQKRSSGENPAQAGHGGAFPDSTHDRTIWSIWSSHVAVTKSMSAPTVGRSHVSFSMRAEATHVSPDNSGNKSESIESPISDVANG